MKTKPIIVVCGEPFSVFSELFFKLYKKKFFYKLKKPIILIGSEKLIYEINKSNNLKSNDSRRPELFI